MRHLTSLFKTYHKRNSVGRINGMEGAKDDSKFLRAMDWKITENFAYWNMRLYYKSA